MSELSKTNGTTTSANNRAEVTHISRNGLILWVKDREYVQLLGRERIRWDALDVDLSLSIIANPDKYPLVSK